MSTHKPGAPRPSRLLRLSMIAARIPGEILELYAYTLQGLWIDRKEWRRWPRLYPASVVAVLGTGVLAAWCFATALRMTIEGNPFPCIAIIVLWFLLASAVYAIEAYSAPAPEEHTNDGGP